MTTRLLTACLTAFLLSAASLNAEEAQKSPSAEDLMIRAHKNRATWAGFPGFAAELVVAEDGRETTGKLTVSADGELSLELAGSLDWAERKLESLVAHRMGTADTEYDVSFADKAKNHPLGRLIAINDDRLMGSRYRVQDDLIREVHRAPQNIKFTITVLDVNRNPEGNYLPKYYTVSFWDKETGKLKSTSTVLDDWKRVGEWDLPARQLTVESADGERSVKEIRLKNHRLLTEKKAAGR